MEKIRAVVVGFGNIGQHAAEACLLAEDFELAGIVRRNGSGFDSYGDSCSDSSRSDSCNNKKNFGNIKFIDEETDISVLGKVDVALLCKPTRQIEEYALRYLSKGIHTVDSFDIHSAIVPLRDKLGKKAKENKTVAIVSAGWDPGSDSVVRALLEAVAPVGITYTNFGPGMSMGHSVAAKSYDGVADALSLTVPLGTGIHRRMLYIQLDKELEKELEKNPEKNPEKNSEKNPEKNPEKNSEKNSEKGQNNPLDSLFQKLKNDDYFKHDELHIIVVPNVSALADKGHGVLMTRKGRSAASDNQLFTFEMRVHNPALTAQIMVSCARAATRQLPGAYTMIEIPLIDLLPGDRDGIIDRLV